MYLNYCLLWCYKVKQLINFVYNLSSTRYIYLQSFKSNHLKSCFIESQTIILTSLNVYIKSKIVLKLIKEKFLNDMC